jgi:NADPH2:quinone reductase
VEAVWYDRQGPAGDVLQIGELPDPDPAAGEVRVRNRFSGVNPGNTKKRGGWAGLDDAPPSGDPAQRRRWRHRRRR